MIHKRCLLHVCRPLDCTALEKKLQQWEAGRSAKAKISTDIVLKHLLEIAGRDFSNNKNHGLGKTPNFSGVDVNVDMKSSRKIASNYIIDKVANETDYVCYCLNKDFLCCYVDVFIACQTQDLDKMFDEHADWLHSGCSKSTQAEAVFDITPKKRGARASILAN